MSDIGGGPTHEFMIKVSGFGTGYRICTQSLRDGSATLRLSNIWTQILREYFDGTLSILTENSNHNQVIF
jgi:hypothetical protein